MSKIQISRIDADGFYIEPILATQNEVNRHLDTEDDFTLGSVVIDKVQEGLHNPKWDVTNLVWIEGKADSDLLAQAKEQKIAEIKNIAGEKINAIAPVWKQVNVIRETGKTAAIFTDIDAIRTKSDDLELKVKDSTTDTVAKVEAIVWT